MTAETPKHDIKGKGEDISIGCNMPATIPVVDLEKTAVLPTSIPRYVANGVDIDAHDIETLNVGEMLNDKMVKILMR